MHKLLPNGGGDLFLNEGLLNFLEPSFQSEDFLLFPSSDLHSSSNRSVEYFCTRASTRISGLDNPQFWQRIVGQIGREEPVVKNAIIAVGAAFEATENPNVDDAFSLEAYDQAVASAVELMSGYLGEGNRGVYVVVVTNILFACLEYLRGDVAAFLKHINAGLSIWDGFAQGGSCPTSSTSSRSSSASSSPYSLPLDDTIESDIANELASIFDKLRLQTSMQCLDPPAAYSPQNAGSADEFTTLPLVLTSLPQAAKHFFDILQRIMRLQIPCVDKITPVDQIITYTQLFRRFNHWRTAFTNYLLFNSTYHSPAEERTAKVLEIYSLGTYTSLATFHSTETAYDSYQVEFEQLVSIAEELVTEAILQDRDLNGIGSLSSFNLGIIPGLHHTALHCRFPSIRRRVISLLASTHWSEGIFDSTRSARIAQKIMEVEEAGLIGPLSDVNLPDEDARVQRFEVLEERSGQVLCLFLGEEGRERRVPIDVAVGFGRGGKKCNGGVDGSGLEDFQRVVNCQ
jgi:hypothetical protein